MNLAELGSFVRKKRESKNLSIADVSQAIKISKQNLTAIEEGDLKVVGYETYYKSFLKCYVQYLGCSFDEYQDLVKNVDEFSEEVVAEKTLKPQYGESEEKKVKPRDKKLAIQLLVLAILGGSAYFYFSQSDMFGSDKAEVAVIEEKAAQPAPVVQKETVKAPAQEAAVEQKDASPAVEQKTQEAAEPAQKEAVQPDDKQQNTAAQKGNKKDEKEVNTAEQKTSELVAQKTENKLEPKKEEAQPVDLENFLKENPSAQAIDWKNVAAPANGEQQAVMYAKQDCWMQFNQDGKTGHFILRRGEQRVFNFKESLYFKIANGSAITLFHNKKPVAVGDSSKVREVNLK